jgi:homoserine O-acetyltransferase
MSDQSMEEKFSRKLKNDNLSFQFIDYFDLSGKYFIPDVKKTCVRFLVISFKSDWLYPSYQSQDIVWALKRKHAYTTYFDLISTYGHDAFLIEIEDETRLVKYFLANIYQR